MKLLIIISYLVGREVYLLVIKWGGGIVIKWGEGGGVTCYLIVY